MNSESLINTIEHVLAHDMDCKHMQKFSPRARLNEDLYIDSVLLMQLLIHLELNHDIEISRGYVDSIISSFECCIKSISKV